MKKIFVVGLGPGSLNQATERALMVLEESDVIVGYNLYIDLVKERFQHKKMIATSMKKEADRCNMAVDEAEKGNTVSMVSSGDAGVYGMAGLIFEITKERGLLDDIEIEVVPGITAACSGAALLGAPLTHDFAVISLSDLLTPWELILKRIECAAIGDFVICLYNPSSVKRHDYLMKACDIVLKYRKPESPAGYTKNIGRIGETAQVTDLQTLRNTKVDMFTTVFIGNSKTKNIGGKLVTPRGYKLSERTGEKDE